MLQVKFHRFVLDTEVSVMNNSPYGGELGLTFGCKARIGKN